VLLPLWRSGYFGAKLTDHNAYSIVLAYMREIFAENIVFWR